VIDPDVVLPERASWDVIAAISAGGVLGAEGRYGLALAVPHAGSAFPWSTLVINVSGCLLIGVLMAILLSRTRPHRLVRPFLGVGILGGYTTFSTFALDADRLVHAHRIGLALAYLAATIALAAAAVWLATVLTQAVLARWRSR
jgi:CrcB protein